MKISVIGSGCPTCESLYNKVKKLKEEGKIDAEIEYIKDVNELVNRGIMGSPALLIDDKPVHVGMPKSDEKLLEIVKKHSK
jgi:small redox-active disulfide protein 2